MKNLRIDSLRNDRVFETIGHAAANATAPARSMTEIAGSGSTEFECCRFDMLQLYLKFSENFEVSDRWPIERQLHHSNSTSCIRQWPARQRSVSHTCCSLRSREFRLNNLNYCFIMLFLYLLGPRILRTSSKTIHIYRNNWAPCVKTKWSNFSKRCEFNLPAIVLTICQSQKSNWHPVLKWLIGRGWAPDLKSIAERRSSIMSMKPASGESMTTFFISSEKDHELYCLKRTRTGFSCFSTITQKRCIRFFAAATWIRSTFLWS